MSLISELEKIGGDVAGFLKSKVSAAEDALQPLVKELETIAQEDLKLILGAGVASVESGLQNGSSSQQLIADAMAAVKAAAEKSAVSLSETAATGLAASLAASAQTSKP